jgi:integrase
MGKRAPGKLPRGIFIRDGAYWLHYYVNGKRKRERIGPDRRLAEMVLKKRKVEIAEGKFLDKQRPVTTTFRDLADAYLKYAKGNKRSWNRDATSIRKLGEVFGRKRLTEITPSAVERYKAGRLASVTIYGRHPRPVTVNRELACLKEMFNVARKGLIDLKGGVPTDNPVSGVTFLDEQNVRDRVLTPEEFQRMLGVSPDYLKPVLLCAYHTGMRRGEILGLTWDRVDLKSGFIRLKETDTKTGERRHIPVGRELRRVLESLPIAMDPNGRRVPYVFTRRGKPIKSVREIFSRVCRDAELTDLVFHDLRHTATPNLRRAGVDALTAMKITGHKTMAVFKRYNTIDEPDLLAAQQRMDGYLEQNSHQNSHSGKGLAGTSEVTY